MYTSLLLWLILSGTSAGIADNGWKVQRRRQFDFCYSAPDVPFKREYLAFCSEGVRTVEQFFECSFRERFRIFVHPDRASLDSTWRMDWGMPDFASECWMVASGVAHKLDLLAPATWNRLACEHRFEDKAKTQGVITHELVHVLHGQFNISPDFSDVQGIDWFVEGLATYASGQCTATRMQQVYDALEKGEVPSALDEFWTGPMRYGLSGSVVMYIDATYGRDKLRELLPFNRKSSLLEALGITEVGLLNGWRQFMKEGKWR